MEMLHLMIVGNEYACRGLMIIALSYIKHNSAPVTVHFLSMDWHEAKPQFVPPHPEQLAYIEKIFQEGNPESKILYYDVSKHFHAIPAFKKYANSSYTPYAMLRLFSDKLDLPDKVLYLDTDVVILGNIEPLYNTELGDHEFAACYDQHGTFWINKFYQNSGVILFNIPRVKETGLMEKCRQLLIKKHPILFDQDALNQYVLEKQYLPQIYNEQLRAKDETVIRHFSKALRFFPIFHTLNVKVWDTKRLHKVDDPARFQDILDQYAQRWKEYSAL